MSILKSLVIAFSIYSKIPMPQFAWEKEDMRYHLIFFPWVGAVIGGIILLLFRLFGLYEFPQLFCLAVISSVPLLISGGFHLDGYMDVRDALSSYAPMDKKHEILKDPHIGAFAVISLLTYGILWGGALSFLLERISGKTDLVFALSFVLSRALSGIAALTMKKAKPDGMLQQETKGAGKMCTAVLILEALFTAGIMLWADLYGAMAVLAAAALFLLYYRMRMYKEFGGVSGDTAGYFVCVCEELCLMALAARSVF